MKGSDALSLEHLKNKKNGITYVYESSGYWDKEKQQARNTRTCIGNLKERLNLHRTSVSSDENLDGKLFVQFIALIYLSYIKKMMADNNLFKSYMLQELLDELDIIERFEQPGCKNQLL